MNKRICKKCHVTLNEDANFCIECGTKNEKPAKDINTIYLTSGSNALSIVGIVMAIFFPPLGLIFSTIAFIQVRKNPQEGDTLAYWGILLSVTMLFLYAIILSIVLQRTDKIFISL